MESLIEYKIKLGEHSKTWHFLYLRQHRVREMSSQMPSDRTVFVAGVPFFMNEDSLRSLFIRFGPVKEVYIKNNLQTPKNSQKSNKMDAYVVFETSKGLENAIEKHQSGILKTSTLTTGLKKWSGEFNKNIPDSREVQSEIDAFMNKFDSDEKQQDEKMKEAAEVDEDGWTTVTKKSRNPGFTRKESVLKHISENVAKKKEKKELHNFYRFQIKESKMKNLLTLRQKFEEDRKKIAALMATRRFKPF